MLDQPFHCPTRPWVSEPSPAPGSTTTVTIEIPDPTEFHTVQLRTVRDGEGDWVMGTATERPGGGQVWTFELGCHNPVVQYRFRLLGPSSTKWLTGIGVIDYDPADHFDFRLLTTGAAPDWVTNTVWYQIFPDRFAATGAYDQTLPDWAHRATWDDPVESYPKSMTQLYGGDLDGITNALDYLVDLGVGGIYLNPIFPARSNHRYDASTFSMVDPLLGGDEALARLVSACHDRGLRVLLDLTLNHTGDGHEWFQAAIADSDAPEVDYYYFTDYPNEYASWLGVSSLPKLNHANDEMATKFYRGPDSVVARYLNEPFNIDGWRIDVANMTGRYEMVDINDQVRGDARHTIETVGTDRWLLGEHFFDASSDVLGDGWHGIMNYKGVARPIWSWLAADDALVNLMAGPGVDARDGIGVARSIDEVMASLPYQVSLASMALIGSHDTPRLSTLLRSPELLPVALTMLFTLPGSPCFLYGDERGMAGATNETARAPMTWDTEPDESIDSVFRSLIALRSGSDALATGGFRWIERGADSLCYLREAPDERLLVRLCRTRTDPFGIDPAHLDVANAERLFGTGSLSADGRLDADGPSATVWRIS